jgi:hypothetical protein
MRQMTTLSQTNDNRHDDHSLRKPRSASINRRRHRSRICISNFSAFRKSIASDPEKYCRKDSDMNNHHRGVRRIRRSYDLRHGAVRVERGTVLWTKSMTMSSPSRDKIIKKVGGRNESYR